MRLRWTPVARAELFEAVRFYEEHRLRLGREFLEEVKRSVALMAQYPKAAPVLHMQARQRRTERFPYRLVHIVRESDVVIIAVAHLKREPNYWHQGLKDID